MPNSGFMRMMSQIEVHGSIKRGFLSRNNSFEILVYFTPMTKRIVDIIPSGLKLEDLILPFGKGDHIDKLREWVSDNNYEIVVEINK
jgi:hypothetical protein